MIKYVILVWRRDDIGDIKILHSSLEDGEVRVFNKSDCAEVYMKMMKLDCKHCIVGVPIIEE